MSLTNTKNLHTRGILLLLVTTLIWGTTFPVIKQIMVSVSPMALVAVRFLLAALVFTPWLRQVNLQLLRDGMLLGSAYLASFVTLTVGMETISADRAAFVLSLNIIFVPLFGLFLGQRLQAIALVAAGVAIAGIGIMSWEGGGLGLGDLWVFGSAVSYAVYILLLETATLRHPPLALSAIQLAFVAEASVMWAAPEIMAQLPEIAAHWGQLMYLGLIVTATTTIAQAIAQRWVSAHETALIYTLEPVFAAVFSFWLLGEQLSGRGLTGAGLILAAMVLSQSQPLITQWLGRAARPEALEEVMEDAKHPSEASL